jgi:predicted glycosyltransferase
MLDGLFLRGTNFKQHPLVTMEGQANNVNIKVKSLVHVDDDTATDGELAIKDISDGVENITMEGKKITNICRYKQFYDLVLIN